VQEDQPVDVAPTPDGELPADDAEQAAPTPVSSNGDTPAPAPVGA
jgi:hypothetical protein